MHKIHSSGKIQTSTINGTNNVNFGFMQSQLLVNGNVTVIPYGVVFMQ